MPDKSITEDDLMGAVQLLADALKASIQGKPVPNAAHCFNLAEGLTAGTEFEFKRHPVTT